MKARALMLRGHRGEGRIKSHEEESQTPCSFACDSNMCT
jgi:hypothetical protein